jgi:N-acetylglucosamine kinase-like BadF-type ATPase
VSHAGRPAAQLLLGVDGGATKTVALIADEGGAVLGAGRSGSSDIHGAAGPASAVARVAEAVRRAAAAAGARPSEMAVAVFCLCGADWPEDDDYYATTLAAELELPRPPTVMNDSYATLRAGTPDGVGVALVLGTGGAVAARGPGGEAWFSGFRIEASGAAELGRQVYEHLIRATYGSGAVPGYLDAALAAIGVASVEELVHAVSRVDSPSQQTLARLAPVLLEAGHRGDPEARTLVREHGGMLAGYVRGAARRVGLDEGASTVVLGGGLLRHPCPDLADAVAEGLPGWHVVRASVEPAFGALLLAADQAGARPSRERLRESGPDASFFGTL